MRARLFFGVGAAGVLSWMAALPAAAQTTSSPSTTTSLPPTTTTSVPTGSVLHLGGRGQVAFVAIVIGIFVLLWFSLVLYDRIRTTSWRENAYTRLLESLIQEAKPPSGAALSTDEVQQLAKAIQQPPKGIQGLTRTLLALGLMTLVAVALVSLLVGNPNDASDLLKTVVTALTTALITVVGFYFGARTAQTNDPSPVQVPAGTHPTTSAPAITQQPSDQTVAGGASATFTAAASGNPTPTAQWQVSTAAAPAFSDIPAATSPMLTIAATNPGQSGDRYRVVFTNSAGMATSDPATLTVTETEAPD